MLTKMYGEQRPVTLREISRQERIPEKFLVQIFLLLRKAGLLRSQMGMYGGYFLARSPDQISFAEVIRVLDGSPAPVPCLDYGAPYHRCPEEEGCRVRGVMISVNEAVEGILNHTTLADACHGQGHAAPKV